MSATDTIGEADVSFGPRDGCTIRVAISGTAAAAAAAAVLVPPGF
ncbi:MAG: hypothetical protein FD189_479 [Elusimicrobia bacterium]|nr:MAG: hypothetical protein FD154_1763 [Elusimicrobiota bacterium]KAF0157465.1 MAG: hypothetical protein FD189_479 [Elusimicrobiota bacterium]